MLWSLRCMKLFGNLVLIKIYNVKCYKPKPTSWLKYFDSAYIGVQAAFINIINVLKYKWYSWSNALTFLSSYVCRRDARYTIITLYRCCNNIIVVVITSRHSYVSLYGNLYRHEMSLVCILLSMAWLYWAQRFSHMCVEQPRVKCIRDHETHAGIQRSLKWGN